MYFMCCVRIFLFHFCTRIRPQKIGLIFFFSIQSYYRGIESEINAEISKIQPIMIANLENKDDFQNLDEHTQNYIRNVISAIDINTLSKFQNATQMNSWIDLNILQPITQNKDNVQEKLSELFSLESQNLPADEYINAVNNLVNSIFWKRA